MRGTRQGNVAATGVRRGRRPTHRRQETAMETMKRTSMRVALLAGAVTFAAGCGHGNGSSTTW
jgi:hypothetical protein